MLVLGAAALGFPRPDFNSHAAIVFVPCEWSPEIARKGAQFDLRSTGNYFDEFDRMEVWGGFGRLAVWL